MAHGANLKSRLARSIMMVARWFNEELRHILPITLFFLIGFLLVLVIVKLSLAQFSIHVSTLSRAVLGAAIASKVVLLLKRTPLGRDLAGYPRAVPVLLHTIFYGLAVIVLGLTENVLRARHAHGGLLKAIAYVAAHTEIHRIGAVAVGVSLVFCVYFILDEISVFMGPGILGQLFFTARPIPRPLSAGTDSVAGFTETASEAEHTGGITLSSGKEALP
jgi:hypothetical protein